MFLLESSGLFDGLRGCAGGALGFHSLRFASPVTAEVGHDAFTPMPVVLRVSNAPKADVLSGQLVRRDGGVQSFHLRANERPEQISRDWPETESARSSRR